MCGWKWENYDITLLKKNKKKTLHVSSLNLLWFAKQGVAKFQSYYIMSVSLVRRKLTDKKNSGEICGCQEHTEKRSLYGMATFTFRPSSLLIAAKNDLILTF